jgi:hypothetical protein
MNFPKTQIETPDLTTRNKLTSKEVDELLDDLTISGKSIDDFFKFVTKSYIEPHQPYLSRKQVEDLRILAETKALTYGILRKWLDTNMNCTGDDAKLSKEVNDDIRNLTGLHRPTIGHVYDLLYKFHPMNRKGSLNLSIPVRRFIYSSEFFDFDFDLNKIQLARTIKILSKLLDFVGKESNLTQSLSRSEKRHLRTDTLLEIIIRRFLESSMKPPDKHQSLPFFWLLWDFYTRSEIEFEESNLKFYLLQDIIDYIFKSKSSVEDSIQLLPIIIEHHAKLKPEHFFKARFVLSSAWGMKDSYPQFPNEPYQLICNSKTISIPDSQLRDLQPNLSIESSPSGFTKIFTHKSDGSKHSNKLSISQLKYFKIFCDSNVIEHGISLNTLKSRIAKELNKDQKKNTIQQFISRIKKEIGLEDDLIQWDDALEKYILNPELRILIIPPKSL